MRQANKMTRHHHTVPPKTSASSALLLFRGPAPICLQEFTDFVFSAKNLVVNNLEGDPSKAKEMRFQNAGDVDGQKFDFVVGNTHRHIGLLERGIAELSWL